MREKFKKRLESISFSIYLRGSDSTLEVFHVRVEVAAPGDIPGLEGDVFRRQTEAGSGTDQNPIMRDKKQGGFEAIQEIFGLSGEHGVAAVGVVPRPSK
jgi:hypothetical protein